MATKPTRNLFKVFECICVEELQKQIDAWLPRRDIVIVSTQQSVTSEHHGGGRDSTPLYVISFVYTER